MEDYVNLIVMGIVGVFVIGLGIWIHLKLTAKQREKAKAKKAAAKRAAALAKSEAIKNGANGHDDFEEEYLTTEDNSLPDDSDGEFKDTNMFGLKRRKDGPDVYRDWD